MKLIPVTNQRRKLSGKMRSGAWRFDPAIDDYLEVPDAIGRELVKSGHWKVTEPPKPEKKPTVTTTAKTYTDTTADGIHILEGDARETK